MNTYKQLQQAIIENGGVDCEGEPEAFFFEDRGDHNKSYKTRVAKNICGQCPVRFLCLEYALESNEDFGIWGGLTPTERKDLMRERRDGAVVHRGNTWRADGERLRFAS